MCVGVCVYSSVSASVWVWVCTCTCTCMCLIDECSQLPSCRLDWMVSMSTQQKKFLSRNVTCLR